MHFRREQTADRDALYQLHLAAFKQQEEAILVDWLRKSEAYIPDLSLVLEEDGHLIGHILFTRAQIQYAQGLIDTFALAPVSIHPTHQAQGQGGRLISEGINRAKQENYPHIFVLGYPGYYPRFGFQKASNWRVSCPFEVPDEAFMALELTPGSLQNRVGELVHASPFRGDG